MHKSLRILATIVGLSVSYAPLSAQITNGSFETPVVPAGSFQTFGTGTSFNGWNVVGAPGGIVAIVSGTYADIGFNFPAQSGAQWLDLTGNASNTSVGVQQAISTAAGASYSLSFWVGNIVNPGGPYGTTSTVSLRINGVQSLLATNSGGVGTSTQNWQQFIFPFIAPTASTTIEFYNADPGSDNTNGLDNISLTLVPTNVVPEPASAAMIGLGLMVLVPILRRRRA